MSARVLNFPARLCCGCIDFEVREDDNHALHSFCGLAREPLDDLYVAGDCPGYEPEGPTHA